MGKVSFWRIIKVSLVMWLGIAFGVIGSAISIKTIENKDLESFKQAELIKWKGEWCADKCSNVQDCSNEAATALVEAMYFERLAEKGEEIEERLSAEYEAEIINTYRNGYLNGYSARHQDERMRYGR